MSNLSDLYCADPLKACRKALRITRNIPEQERLNKINELLGTYGTEAIRGEWQKGYWKDIVVVYCNTGDTYKLTVIQVRGNTSHSPSRFIVSTIGDFVERNDKKLGIL